MPERSLRSWRFQERKRLWGAFGLSVLLHLLVALVWVREEYRGLETASPEPVHKFVKRLPPSHRPLSRSTRPERIPRPLTRRPAIHSTPVVAIRPAPLTTPRQGLPGMPIPLMTAPLPPAEIPVQPLAHLPVPHIGPRFQAGALQGTRTGAEEIDLGVELLDVDALDTGQYRALVVIDPHDRQGIKGFLYLSSVYSASIERAEQESRDIAPRPFQETRQVAERRILDGLARLMAEQTQVRAEVREAISLEDPALLKAPFVLFTAHTPFTFTEAEATNLGRYLLAGGFLYAEISDVDYYTHASQGLWDLPALRGLIRTAFEQVGCREGKDWSFQRLELGHPLFRCYYDIPSLPRGYWDILRTVISPSPYEPPDCIEGILLGERLVGIYSQKDYSFFWGDGAQRTRESATSQWIADKWSFGPEVMPCRLGVNVLVYALTREGSLAQRRVAVE